MRAALKIQSGGREVFKGAVLEHNMICILDRNSGGRAANPREIVESTMVRRAGRREFLRIEQEHSGLQRNMALPGWPQPGGVGECDAFELNICRCLVQCALNANQCFDGGSKNFCTIEIFILPRPVINFSSAQIFKPFAGRIKELNGIGQKERRVVVRIYNYWRPGMLEFKRAFGLLEC